MFTLGIAVLLLAQTPVETAQKKMRATEMYRTRKFEAACALFEQVVTEQKYDAWGWNDLAVCRIHMDDLRGALDAMEKASALEKAIGGDEPLMNAVNANEALLVAATTKRKTDGMLAGRLAARRKTTNETSACELYELATQLGATLEQEDWNFVAFCRVEKKPAPAEQVVEALRHVENFFEPALELGHRERTRRGTGISADWKTSCTPLAAGTCGAKILACSKQSQSDENYTAAYTESLVFIEAASLKKWKKSPFDKATETQLLTSEHSTSPVRCPAGEDGMTALDSVEGGHLLLTVDACARSATFLKFERQCSHGSTELVNEPIEIISPR